MEETPMMEKPTVELHALGKATAIICDAERELGPLERGQMIDLLLDNDDEIKSDEATATVDVFLLIRRVLNGSAA
jgi:hypothetical protein